jgi:hypothetical protein
VYATGSSEKWVNLYQSTRSHNTEHIILHSHRWENLKFHFQGFL